MSAANALSSDPSPSATPEVRPTEPSMEDILASIRRIIADDQTRGLTGSPSSLRRTAALNVTPPLAARAERPAPPPRPQVPPSAEPSRSEAALAVPVIDAVPVESTPPDAAPVAAPPVAPAPISLSQALASHVSAETADPPRAPPEPVAAIEAPEHMQAISAIAEAGVAAILGPVTTSVPPAAASEPEMDPTPDAYEDPDVLALNGYEAGAAEAVDPLLSDEVGASIESSFQQLATSVFMRNTGAVDGMIRDMLRPLLKTWLDDNLPTIVERLVRAEIERVARGDRR